MGGAPPGPPSAVLGGPRFGPCGARDQVSPSQSERVSPWSRAGAGPDRTGAERSESDPPPTERNRHVTLGGGRTKRLATVERVLGVQTLSNVTIDSDNFDQSNVRSTNNEQLNERLVIQVIVFDR